MTKHDAARKQRIIDYIAATLRTRGYPPSVREIAQRGRAGLDVRRPPPPRPRWSGTATSSVVPRAPVPCA